MAPIKYILTRIHFSSLAFVVINFLLRELVSFNSNIVFIVKIIICVTGAVLFIYNFRPFKKKAIYYAAYVFSPLLVIIAWLVDGIFGAILASALLFFIYPKEEVYKKNGIIIYKEFAGFLNVGRTYEINETKLLLFEKPIGRIRTDDPLDFENSSVIIKKDSAVVKYKLSSDENIQIMNDTVASFKIY
jgi:hypothetical protein